MTNEIDKGTAIIHFATIMLILSTLIALSIKFIFYLYETNEFGIKPVVLVLIVLIYGIYLMRYEMHTEIRNPFGEKTRLLIFIIMIISMVMMIVYMVELI